MYSTDQALVYPNHLVANTAAELAGRILAAVRNRVVDLWQRSELSEWVPARWQRAADSSHIGRADAGCCEVRCVLARAAQASGAGHHHRVNKGLSIVRATPAAAAYSRKSSSSASLAGRTVARRRLLVVKCRRLAAVGSSITTISSNRVVL